MVRRNTYWGTHTTAFHQTQLNMSGTFQRRCLDPQGWHHQNQYTDYTQNPHHFRTSTKIIPPVLLAFWRMSYLLVYTQSCSVYNCSRQTSVSVYKLYINVTKCFLNLCTLVYRIYNLVLYCNVLLCIMGKCRCIKKSMY